MLHPKSKKKLRAFGCPRVLQHGPEVGIIGQILQRKLSSFQIIHILTSIWANFLSFVQSEN
jgi:hypothetical protein